MRENNKKSSSRAHYNSGRGGYRANAGRKTKRESEHIKPVTVNLFESQIPVLEKLGRSEYLRNLLDYKVTLDEALLLACQFIQANLGACPAKLDIKCLGKDNCQAPNNTVDKEIECWLDYFQGLVNQNK